MPSSAAWPGVENDVIPYGMALGNRAHLAGLNIVGLKRRGFSREQIHDLRRAYRLLFADEGTLKERVEDVAAEFAPHPQVQEILDFIRDGGDRSICTPRNGGGSRSRETGWRPLGPAGAFDHPAMHELGNPSSGAP